GPFGIGLVAQAVRVEERAAYAVAGGQAVPGDELGSGADVGQRAGAGVQFVLPVGRGLLAAGAGEAGPASGDQIGVAAAGRGEEIPAGVRLQQFTGVQEEQVSAACGVEARIAQGGDSVGVGVHQAYAVRV